MFERALICTDLLDGLHRLVHCVPHLALSGLKQVIFLHSIPVWEQPTLATVDQAKVDAAKQKLSLALENIPDGMTVSVEISNRRPVDAVQEILSHHAIDVIFLCHPMRGAVQEKLFGSTSLAIASITDIPLLIFRPQLLSVYTLDELALRCQHLWKSLLIPYDGSADAIYLIEQIEKYASTRTPDSFEDCILVRVVENISRDPSVTECRLNDARQELESVQARLEKLGLQVRLEVRLGTPVLEVLAVAADDDISAIAVATSHRSNLLEWLAVRRINEDILHQLWFPLLFFSPKE
jgi:nucleotide-binding universal stress UspA family protein